MFNEANIFIYIGSCEARGRKRAKTVICLTVYLFGWLVGWFLIVFVSN